MNKEQLIITLQSCLFAFEGLNETEILNLNSNYNYNKDCIIAGIKLCEYLNLTQKGRNIAEILLKLEEMLK